MPRLIVKPHNCLLFNKIVPNNYQLLLMRNFGNDTGTEELAHFEMVGAIVQQLTRDVMSPEEIKANGYEGFYVEHGFGVFPQDAGGGAFTAHALQSKGDPIADLYENMAAEQKARVTYEYLLDMIDDPEVAKPIKFLREREIVHFQRFGEALNYVRDYQIRHNVFYVR